MGAGSGPAAGSWAESGDIRRGSYSSRAPRPAVFLLCSGLGHAVRGFETFALECFAALRNEPGLRMTLVKARGPARGEDRTLRTPGRDSRTARVLGRAARRDGYFAEQMLYALRVAPLLLRARPDVVYVSDWALAGALGRLRAVTGAPYRVLLSNGAPGPPPYDWTVDHVQHLTPEFYELSLEIGQPPERHTLLPLGVEMPPEPPPVPSPDDRAALRRRLALPADAEIVLCVAALNLWSKRLDYLIGEVASLSPRPHLVLLGQREDETPSVLTLADSALGPDGYTARTVTPGEVADFYRAADTFALASQHEAMGRVLVEALSHGLPTVSHDAPVMQMVTGDQGLRGDLGRPGALAELLVRAREGRHEPRRRRARHAFVFERFSWTALRPRYVDMLTRCAALPLDAARGRRRA